MQQVKGCKDTDHVPSMARILTLTGHKPQRGMNTNVSTFFHYQ